jgi:hypothetical protein
MFVFAEIKKTYQCDNSEEQISERLNELTNNVRGRILHGRFIGSDPLTFEFYHPYEMMYTSKPLATKVTVTLSKEVKSVLLSVKTTTNPMYIMVSMVLAFSFLVQIVRQPSLKQAGIYLLALAMIVLWDRRAKMSTLARLERVLR